MVELYCTVEGKKISLHRDCLQVQQEDDSSFQCFTKREGKEDRQMEGGRGREGEREGEGEEKSLVPSVFPVIGELRKDAMCTAKL